VVIRSGTSISAQRNRTAAAPQPRRNVLIEGEHPMVVLEDLAARPRPDAHIIVLANEKGGVGKSTVAFHTCMALCDQGFKVAAVDLDFRQQSLARVLAFREATARRLGIELPSPQYTAMHHTSGALLCQELARVGWHADYIVIDVAGHDSPLARRAIALANTLVTPVNSSFVDLDLLGRFNPSTQELLGPGFFANMVNELREERLRRDMGTIDWVVMQNRVRRGISNNQARVDGALQCLAPRAGFRLGQGLTERVAYRELFLLGLTHLDLRHIPDLSHMRAQARDEIFGLLEDMGLPRPDAPGAPGARALDEAAHLAAEALAAAQAQSSLAHSSQGSTTRALAAHRSEASA